MFDPLNGNSFTLTFTRAELKLLAFALDFVDDEGGPKRYPAMNWDPEFYELVSGKVRQPWLDSMALLACGTLPGCYSDTEERDYSGTLHRMCHVSKRTSFARMVKFQIMVHQELIKYDEYAYDFKYWNAVY